MRHATKSDKKKFIEIIAESFDTNPSVNWVIKNDSKRTKRIRAVANYAFEKALLKQGAYISSDETGIALCYKYNKKSNFIRDYWNQVKLAVVAIGIERIIEVLNREAYLEKLRPKSGEFLYFWFFGVSNEGKGKGAAKELKDYIFNLSDKTGLSIYLETSVAKNKNVYERYGFELYHSWEVKEQGITLWFMKRNALVGIRNWKT